jgi:hypothetical protein
MKNKELKLAPIVKIIIIFMICSFIFGILLAFKNNVNLHEVESNISFLRKIISCFVFNFCFVFLTWLFGKTKGMFLLSYLLVFIKCLFFGIVFITNLKGANIISFLKYFLLDLVLLYPLFGFMLYDISLYNFYNKKQFDQNFRIIIYTIWLIVYSVLCGIIGSKL